ncbi:MAG: HD domain-containing phosphohydrolase [Vicinamibacterales bacterium]
MPAAAPFIPNILVVDDEPAVRDYICDCLTVRSSYRCTGVGDARAALAVARETSIDVALLDLAIPEEDGVTLARRLRDEVRDLAVVLITGTQSFDAAVEAMRIGVLDYLLKPFAMPELMDSVERAVAWRHAALQATHEREDLERLIGERATRLRQAFGDLEVASSAALEALLTTLSQRNPETLEHARRVARYALAVAEELGIEEPARGAVERGALLHDLGKVAIPDAVMYKPGPLSDDEFAIMRSHAQIGHDIAATVPFLRTAAEIVLATHERYDGKGYPRGLTGEDIPIGARIIAVVDVFDALTSSRVYRDAVCVAAANAELVRSAGTHFDPHIVAAWLRCVDECLDAPAVARDAHVTIQ